ncbi:hypothetical protein HAZT_HAZT003607 [Hyalella azteca]|uniref:Reelin domain-containing protein n=1 Tax=Hyalella azteca TaxID=294128 RepID=A0A6A0GU28_HYAAZ|nr:hypothetical protein HAZT_HAZT003607 [Hyalella azteca]
MVPSHGGQAPQSTQSPFQITPGGASTNGSPVSVTLAGVSPTANFKGFFLQARDANTSVVIGRFTTTSHKLVNCDSSIEVSFPTFSRVTASVYRGVSLSFTSDAKTAAI